VVVVRGEGDALTSHPGFDGFEMLACAAARHGMGHSLAAGVAAAPQAAGWLIALADMPYIAPATYDAVVAALRAGAALAQPSFQGAPGHPVGFASRWFEDLVALTGDAGARELVRSNARLRTLCAVDDPGILQDVDVPGDLEQPGVQPSLLAERQ